MEGSGDMAKTVMIVEDNELNMKLFHDLLEAHGYSTVGTQRHRSARSGAPASY
jgi:two-component system cell cycle response regulator DivK